MHLLYVSVYQVRVGMAFGWHVVMPLYIRTFVNGA